jgi:hypothetical protein
MDWLDTYADWFGSTSRNIGDFFVDTYSTGTTLSDPTSTIGQLICGDIYGNQIWGDPGIYVNAQWGPVPTPVGPIVVGGGIEIIYDWANDGKPGTGWNIFVYPQGGASTQPGPSIGIGAVHVYNFTPEDYTESFINFNVSGSYGYIGGPSLGYSIAPKGLDQWVSGQPVTYPYSYSGGWNWSSPGVSGGGSYQYYFLRNEEFGIEPPPP